MSDDTLVSSTIKRLLNNRIVAWVVIPVIITTGLNTALKTGVELKTTLTPAPKRVRILNVVTGEHCTWGPVLANTSRGDQVNAARMGIYEPKAPHFPLYTGQISLRGVPDNQLERIKASYTVDPVFDVLLLNNSDDSIVITAASFVVEKAWSEPKAMPKGGRLEIQDMVVIQTRPFSEPTTFKASLRDPIQLPPKGTYRFLVWIKDLDENSAHNELLAKIKLETSDGSVETPAINLSFV
jgi:hypothetical protein